MSPMHWRAAWGGFPRLKRGQTLTVGGRLPFHGPGSSQTIHQIQVSVGVRPGPSLPLVPLPPSFRRR